MKNCIFTIVAKNYIGLAKILEQSVSQHCPEADFRIFVVDPFEKRPDELSDNILFVKETAGYGDAEWTDMAFKYDLTEMCTAVKPACFQHLFREDYDNVIYFDPDIYVFSSLDVIFEKLSRYSVVLTPQIANIHVDYRGEHPEWAMNVNGIFNLGFCAMHRSATTDTVLAWWRRRLMDNCFTDRSVGNFTDQKWMDWMPGLLGNEALFVCRHLGMNVAPWNFFERELFMSGAQLCVRGRGDEGHDEAVPLVFFHFAGYDYSQLKQGHIVRKRIENLQEYADIALATEVYMHVIRNNAETFDAYITQDYSYGTFENGQRIDSFHRRLYHGLTLNGRQYANPFGTGDDSFFHALKKKGMIVPEKIDNLTQRNISNLEGKRRMIHRLFGMLYRLMGYKRYALFVKSLYNYCRPEMHTFLVEKHTKKIKK